MAFHIGQKVVCISDKWRNPHTHECPVKGRVYTIRAIGGPDLEGQTGVIVEEIRNPPESWRLLGEVGFRAVFFRPLVERKTDTGFAILEEIRRRETVPAREPALTAPQPAQSGDLS